MKPAAAPLAPALDLPPQQEPGFSDTGYMTVAQVIRELQVSRPTLDRLVAEGMPAVNVGTRRKRCLRFPRVLVAAWLRRRQ